MSNVITRGLVAHSHSANAADDRLISTDLHHASLWRVLWPGVQVRGTDEPRGTVSPTSGTPTATCEILPRASPMSPSRKTIARPLQLRGPGNRRRLTGMCPAGVDPMMLQCNDTVIVANSGRRRSGDSIPRRGLPPLKSPVGHYVPTLPTKRSCKTSERFLDRRSAHVAPQRPEPRVPPAREPPGL